MKAVLVSIKPKWCLFISELIKTIEVRKTKPNLETPFKCYIYCTKAKSHYSVGHIGLSDDELYRLNDGQIKYGNSIELMLNNNCTVNNFLNGKVIGEFVCDYIETFGDDVIHSFSNEEYSRWNDFDLNRACIHPQDFEEYANDSLLLYGWHISELIIYDKPKELSEFGLSRAPQSWCHVEVA